MPDRLLIDIPLTSTFGPADLLYVCLTPGTTPTDAALPIGALLAAVGAGVPVVETVPLVFRFGHPSALVGLDASLIPDGTTRRPRVQNAAGTLALLELAQVFLAPQQFTTTDTTFACQAVGPSAGGMHWFEGKRAADGYSFYRVYFQSGVGVILVGDVGGGGLAVRANSFQVQTSDGVRYLGWIPTEAFQSHDVTLIHQLGLKSSTPNIIISQSGGLADMIALTGRKHMRGNQDPQFDLPYGAGGFDSVCFHSSDTSTVTYVGVWQHQTSSTPSGGFGLGWRVKLSVSDGTIASAFDIVTRWAVTTAGSQDSQVSFDIYHGGTANTVLQLEMVGTGKRIGFLGATPAARQTVTGSRGGNAALTSLLTGLASLGLIEDLTTP